MFKMKLNRKHWSWVIFVVVFGLSLALGVALSLTRPVEAAPSPAPTGQAGPSYAGSQACANCHTQIHTDWTSTRHAQAFSSPIFQRDWSALKSQAAWNAIPPVSMPTPARMQKQA